MRAVLIPVLSMVGLAGFAAEQTEPALKDAFAVIHGKRADGGGYHPFYNYVIAPHAVVSRRVVYCAYQNTRGQPMAALYDVRRKQWIGPVRASKIGLGGDDHGNPSIYLDRKGYVHLFYGCHNRAMRHTRSEHPHDITAWSERKSPTGHATYPQTMRLADGTFCLFCRAGGHPAPWTMRTSLDDCRTWRKGERIIEMRAKPRDPRAAAYCCFFPGTERKTIHCFWNFKDDDPRRRPKAYPDLRESVYRYNIYYIRRDAEGIWRNAAGEEVALPVSKVEADAKCMVYNSGEQFAYPSSPIADAEDRPYVRISTGVQDWQPGKRRVIVPMRTKFATLREGKWEIVDEVPKRWPGDVTAVLRGPGPHAFGDAKPERWFIFYRRFEKDRTGIFLYGTKTGYARRVRATKDAED